MYSACESTPSMLPGDSKATRQCLPNANTSIQAHSCTEVDSKGTDYWPAISADELSGPSVVTLKCYQKGKQRLTRHRSLTLCQQLYQEGKLAELRSVGEFEDQQQQAEPSSKRLQKGLQGQAGL